MTPQERQEKIDFIIQSHASSAARMDRIESDLAESRAEQKAFNASLVDQKERLEGLMRLSQQFLDIVRAEHEARKAEIEAEREKRKALEGRVDGVEEMTRFLRQWLEGNLRPPEKPPETEN
jgi:hypothetical protein